MTQPQLGTEMSVFEWRSCASKRRYAAEPVPPSIAFYSYHCRFCDGWHLATCRWFKRRVAALNKEAQEESRRL